MRLILELVEPDGRQIPPVTIEADEVPRAGQRLYLCEIMGRDFVAVVNAVSWAAKNGRLEPTVRCR